MGVNQNDNNPHLKMNENNKMLEKKENVMEKLQIIKNNQRM